LAHHFLRRAGDSRPWRLTAEAAEALRAYPFPGNVRELENALIHAVALCSDGLITRSCLPSYIAAAGAPATASSSVAGLGPQLVADRPTMDELQRRYLQLVLGEVGGNRRRAAKVLGLNRRTIQRLIARYHLEVPADVETAKEMDHFSPAETHEPATRILT
jgi:DNA-binding NtrC family response regulator